MSSPSYAVQCALGDRLAGSPDVTALVPADRIVAVSGLPEGPWPLLTIGQDHEVADDVMLSRRHVRVWSTLHAWADEGGVTAVKRIAGAVQTAIRGELPELLDGLALVDWRYDGATFMRDPKDPTLAHAVITIEALVELPT